VNVVLEIEIFFFSTKSLAESIEWSFDDIHFFCVNDSTKTDIP
jgi:hypothetical protein